MPTKTFRGLNSLQTGTDFHAMLEDDVAPPAATSSTGVLVANSSAAAPAGYAVDANSNTQVIPGAGTSGKPAAPNNTNGNAYRTPTALAGKFAAGTWTLDIPMQSTQSAINGGIRLRIEVYKASSETGATPTKLTSSTLLTQATTVPLLSEVVFKTTWTAPEITLATEYLFFCIAWEVTAASTANTSRSGNFRQGTHLIATPDFTAGGQQEPVQTLQMDVGCIPVLL